MKLSELRELLIAAVRKNLTQEEAEYFADEVIETDARKRSDGKYSRGLVKDMRSWKAGSTQIQKTIDLPGFTQYNFQGLGPSLKLKEIHDELERKAKANGIAMISIVNSGGMHAMHLWTQGLAKRGLFALGAWNGGPDAVIPFNGTRGIFGTNPLTYGFPSDTGEVVVDMATSEIPFFKILEAKKTDSQLPPNTAVNNQGELTTDPKEAIDEQEVSNLVPMGGGYKGYTINYLIEIMTSALVGARASSQMSPAYIETEHGGFIIVIEIDRVTDRANYDATVQSMNEKIRAQTPKVGVEKVIVPGDTNLDRKRGISADTEIEVSEEYRTILVELANQ